MTDPPFEHARPSLRLDEPELPVADADESEVTSAAATVALSDVESELERRPLRSVTEEIFGESDSDEEVLKGDGPPPGSSASEPFAPPRTATEEIFGESDSSDEEVPETTPAQDYYYI